MGPENGQNGSQNGNGCSKETSELAFIDFTGNNPFELFKEWQSEARSTNLVTPDALCLSTASKDGKPSSRHVMLRRLDDDGFVIMTDGRSRKSDELAENPHASIAFLWSYKKDNVKIIRQVRIEGHVEDLPQSACQEIWEREPLFCKIRANICHQGQIVDWNELKQSHDRLYQDVINGKQVPSQPNYTVYYKVIPKFVEFYYAYDNAIGDRLAFHGLTNDAKVWKKERIAA